MRRLLLAPSAIGDGVANVEGDSFHYLVRVLRLGVGDPVEIFDGSGRSWPGRIDVVAGERAVIALGAEVASRPVPKLTLVQGLAKADKFEWVIQKATELGMSRFVPLQTERSIVRLDAAKGADRARRWRKIAEEAARQCGRSDVPVVDEPMDLARWLEAARARGETIGVLWEEERATRLGPWLASHLDQPISLVVGPEGGLSAREVQVIVDVGGTALTLGDRILRTETAGLAALSIALHLSGELG